MAAAVALTLGTAVAQNQRPGASSSPDGSGAANMMTPSLTPQGQPHAGARPSSEDVRQGNDSNPAVATSETRANVPTPGQNNYTEAQARVRMEANGYRDIAGLTMDPGGIWRGQAMKDGRQVQVWLDHRGVVGPQ